MLRYALLVFMGCLIGVPAMAQELSEKQILAQTVVEKSRMLESLAWVEEAMLTDEPEDLVLAESVARLDKELYLKNAAQLLVSQFSQEELQALSDFYSTEIGAGIAQKMPYLQVAMGKILENMIVYQSKELAEE